jgi:N-acetylglucosamine-6-phosphate deacetylase
LTLIECITNFINFTGASIPQALNAATASPAAMLGLSGVKGSLESDADADLVILSEEVGVEGQIALTVDEVWKFGAKVFDRSV